MKRGDLRLIGACGLLLAALFLKAAPLGLPAVRADNPPGAFDATRAVSRLARILGDERPHPVDTDANDALRARLLAEIAGLGYAPEVRDDFACNGRGARIACARVRNVVFRAGPERGRAVAIASHYDSVPAGPGAADDGIGVAVSLEIAALLAERPPTRPVLFVITDGEEMGLIGAKSFVEVDPYRNDIARVINLEARGVRGPAQMFETGDPNEADVRAFARGAARPFANSMMTDVYKLLPNDTDVSEFLKGGYGAINFALTEGVAFYHTPHDNLAALDRRSVQHMGDLALGALDASLAERGAPRRGRLIFTDILSRWFVMAPQGAGLALLIAGVIAAAAGFFRGGGGGLIRAAAAPMAGLVAGAGLVAALQWLLSLARKDQHYWMANPWAMQALAYGGALLGAVAAAHFVARGAPAARRVAAAWAWFAAIGLVAYLVAPGSSILFVLPLTIYAAGVAADRAAPGAARWLARAAALAALVVIAPALHLAELGLGFAMAAVPAVVAGLLFMLWAPLAARDGDEPSWAPAGLAAAALAAAFVAALAVPAYSPAAPRPLNLQYHVDADAELGRWLIASTGERAPPALAALAPFAPDEIEGLGPRLVAPAPYLETTPATIELLDETPDGEGRRVRLRLAMAGADQALLRFPAEARARSVAAQGRETLFEGDGRFLACFGRACDGAEFEVALGPEATEWTVLGVRFGLPFAAAPFVSARPRWATPIQNGDVLIVSTKTKV